MALKVRDVSLETGLGTYQDLFMMVSFSRVLVSVLVSKVLVSRLGLKKA